MKKSLIFAWSLLSTVVSYDATAAEENLDSTPVKVSGTFQTTDNTTVDAPQTTGLIEGTLTVTVPQPTVAQTTKTVDIVVPSVTEETAIEEILVPVKVPVKKLTPSIETVSVEVPINMVDRENTSSSTTSVPVKALLDVDPSTGEPLFDTNEVIESRS